MCGCENMTGVDRKPDFYDRKKLCLDRLEETLKKLRKEDKSVPIAPLLIKFENEFGFSRIIKERVQSHIDSGEFLLEEGWLVPIGNRRDGTFKVGGKDEEISKEVESILNGQPLEGDDK